MQTIDQLADGIGKPTKKHAQAILRTLYQLHPEHHLELAELFAFFKPPAPRKVKTQWQWVAQVAAGPKELRHYMQYVHVDSEWVTATDGRRLHRYRTPAVLPSGLYNTEGALIFGRDTDEYGRYPLTRRLWTPPGPFCPLGVDGVGNPAEASNGQCRRIEAIGRSVLVNARYWATSTATLPLTDAEVSVDQNRTVYVRAAEGQAIIAGVRA